MLNNLFWYFNLCDIVITSTDNWKASLAQSVERAAFNRKVVGSSPTGSVFTILIQREGKKKKKKRKTKRKREKRERKTKKGERRKKRESQTI